MTAADIIAGHIYMGICGWKYLVMKILLGDNVSYEVVEGPVNLEGRGGICDTGDFAKRVIRDLGELKKEQVRI